MLGIYVLLKIRQHQDAEFWIAGAQVTHEFDPITLVKTDISDNHIGIGLFDGGEPTRHCVGLRAYDQVARLFDDPPQSFTHNGMAVDNQNASNSALTDDERRGGRE